MSDSFRVSYGGGGLEPLNVPRLSAGTFTVQATGTEVIMVLQSAVPLIDKQSNAFSGQAVLQPIALVSISPGTAKDLHIVLGQVIENFERDVGPIVTPMTVQQDAKQAPLSMPPGQLARA
jgi:hypothetical protein